MQRPGCHCLPCIICVTRGERLCRDLIFSTVKAGLKDRGWGNAQVSLRVWHFLILLILKSGAMLTFTMVPKGGCPVTLVAHTAEGALCVSALAVSAEVLVLALVDICKQERKRNRRNGALEIPSAIHAKGVYNCLVYKLLRLDLSLRELNYPLVKVITHPSRENPDELVFVINV